MAMSLSSINQCIIGSLFKTQLISFLGSIFLDLSLYGLFAENGNGFHPILNAQQNFLIMLVLGSTIFIIKFYLVLKIILRMSAIRK
jgi:hypothetical protein